MEINHNQRQKLLKLARTLSQASSLIEEIFAEQTSLPLSAAAAAEPVKAKPVPPTNQLWEAYSDEFARRWEKEPPPRNAKVNGQLATLVRNFGVEGGVDVVRYFFKVPDHYYIKNYHDLGLLVSQAHRIYASMKTGKTITGKQARDMESAGAFREQINAIERGEV